jgi:hypothetical protein
MISQEAIIGVSMNGSEYAYFLKDLGEAEPAEVTLLSSSYADAKSNMNSRIKDIQAYIEASEKVLTPPEWVM